MPTSITKSGEMVKILQERIRRFPKSNESNRALEDPSCPVAVNIIKLQSMFRYCAHGLLLNGKDSSYR